MKLRTALSLATLMIAMVACTVTFIPRETEYVLVTYAYDSTSETKKLAAVAEESNGDVDLNFDSAHMPSYGDILSKTVDHPKKDIEVVVHDRHGGDSVSQKTSEDGHLSLNIPYTMGLVQVRGWRCEEITSWSEGNLDITISGGTIALCKR